MTNYVYIGTSLDGYIADRNGGLDWLDSIPNPDGDDMGWSSFYDQVDALVIGRVTFETVCGFDVEWPYDKLVFVYSKTLTKIPKGYSSKAELVCGSPQQVVNTLNQRGYSNLYIDGGKTIQSFLTADLVDELIITRLPILLGGGVPLFGELSKHMMFEHINTSVALGELVQSHYRRKRKET